jgi:hypothetical protein
MKIVTKDSMRLPEEKPYDMLDADWEKLVEQRKKSRMTLEELSKIFSSPPSMSKKIVSLYPKYGMPKL